MELLSQSVNTNISFQQFQHSIFAENKSCSQIKLCNPKAPSGYYVIDPDGEGGVTSFTVYCDMTDKNTIGVTVISHDSEDRILVRGCSRPGCYQRDIHYTGANFLQLGNLTFISAHCEQFIKYECFASVMFRSKYSWWLSRDEDQMTYWGGSNSTYPYKCACGVTDTCADIAYGCNCDKNDNVWREDSGLLTNKSHLPVKQLRFGDNSGARGQRGYHTLGKLRCYGSTANKPQALTNEFIN